MLEEIVPIFKNFRDRIYRFFSSRRDAAMELVDALSSNRTASSVVALSLSLLHRRNYCSITRVLDEYMPKCSVEALLKKRELTHLLSNLCPSAQQCGFHLFAVDCTPEPRIFSPTLEDRSYVYAPNA
ncbi:transposase [bacterium]|nr:transposase [bacterium]